RVTVQAGPAGAEAVLQVSDTGPGIPVDELPRIFDRFWRGRGAAHVSGSGVGLAVAAELADAHGGRLEARSEPGHGAQVRLALAPAWPSPGGGGGRPSPRPPRRQHRQCTAAGFPEAQSASRWCHLASSNEESREMRVTDRLRRTGVAAAIAATAGGTVA